jgi:hypothetical protein
MRENGNWERMESRERETRGTAPRDEPGRLDEPVGEAARRGQWWVTPFVVLGSVATVVWVAAGLVTAAVLLIWWLA